MWLKDEIFAQDMERIALEPVIPWEKLHHKRVLITGGTGLIGYTVASALLYYSKKEHADISVVLLVREREKAGCKYAQQIADGCVPELVTGSVERPLPINGAVDYVIHCAAPTSSAYFVSNPVDTIRTLVNGTDHVLTLCRDKRVSGAVFLSSMEVYGQVPHRGKLKEGDLGFIDILSARSSYSEGKRAAEMLCAAYHAQYGAPVTVARLAQTFGPGIAPDDQRVFAYMARCALAGQDISLRTAGTKENMYLYTSDAAAAILLLLLSGERGAAYNVGNPASYCSVKELGDTILQVLGGPGQCVRTSTGGIAGLYRPDGYLNLDIGKLEALGWQPRCSLPEMIRRVWKQSFP